MRGRSKNLESLAEEDTAHAAICCHYPSRLAGKAEWAKRFAPLGAVDYGIGGDSTRQVLWHLGHGLVDGLASKLVVLKIGTNNLYGDHSAGTDEEIARGIETVVKTVREKLPKTRVLLLGILQRCPRSPRIVLPTASASARIGRIPTVVRVPAKVAKRSGWNHFTSARKDARDKT